MVCVEKSIMFVCCMLLLCFVVVKNGTLNGQQSVNGPNCYTKKYVKSVVLIVRGV